MIPGLEFETELEIENHADLLTEEEWKTISFNLHKLSVEFVEKFQDKIKWPYVVASHKNTMFLIIKYQNKIDPNLLYLVSRLCLKLQYNLFGIQNQAPIDLESIDNDKELNNSTKANKIFQLIVKLKETTELNDTRAGI